MANIESPNTYSAAQIGVPEGITFETSITLNMVNSNNFALEPITGNFTLENPINMIAGQSGYIVCKQSGATNGQVTLGSMWKTVGGEGISLTQTLDAVDTIEYRIRSATEIDVFLSANWS